MQADQDATLLADENAELRLILGIYEAALKDIAGCNGGEGYMPTIAQRALEKSPRVFADDRIRAALQRIADDKEGDVDPWEVARNALAVPSGSTDGGANG